MNEQNKRKNIRVDFTQDAKVSFQNRVFSKLETRNLSLKGIFVKGLTGVTVGESCDVELHLSGATNDLFVKMKGEVIRTDNEGTALRFTEIDIESFFHLRNIVYYNSGDPDKVEDELGNLMPLSVPDGLD